MTSIKEFLTHSNRRCRFAWWGRFVGFNAMWYEQHAGNTPPTACGFQLDFGWATLYCGA